MVDNIKSVFSIDSIQNEFLSLLPFQGPTVSLHFSIIPDTVISGKRPPSLAADFFAELVSFLKDISDYLSSCDDEFWAIISIHMGMYDYGLTDHIMVVEIRGDLNKSSLSVCMEERYESTVPYLNRALSSWHANITWMDLMDNLSNLIEEFHGLGLESVEEHIRTCYQDFSSRSFLVEEVKEALAECSSGRGDTCR